MPLLLVKAEQMAHRICVAVRMRNTGADGKNASTARRYNNYTVIASGMVQFSSLSSTGRTIL